MSNELTKNESSALAAIPDFGVAAYSKADDFSEIARPGFLPRLAIINGMSKMASKILPGSIALIRSEDDFVDFGKECHLIPLLFRFAAMRFDPEFEAFYDKSLPEFQKIVEDSQQPNSGCSYGPQFLVYVPATKELATFMFGSTSARPESHKMNARLRQPSKLKSKPVTSGNNSWHVPVVLPSDTVGGELIDFTAKSVEDVVEKFKSERSSKDDAEVDPKKVEGGERAR